MRHCIPRSEWHFWHFGVQIAASQNRPEVLIAESVAVLEPGVNRTPVTAEHGTVAALNLLFMLST